MKENEANYTSTFEEDNTIILSKLKEKENVTIFKKIKHYLFKLFILTSILKVINTKVEITKKR